MKEENPLVSIIVRTKDRPKLLAKALQSIADQNYSPIEVVLVNDGGQDIDIEEIKNILGDTSLIYVRLEKNTGRANAGNVGIEHSKGEYIGLLDDDDEFYPEHISTLISFLVKSDYKVAYTDSLMVYREYNSDTHEFIDIKKELIFSREFDYDFLIFENYIPFMCLLFEREILITSGAFDGSLDLYEDWDLLLRIGEKYPLYHIEKITAHYNQWSLQFQISQRNRNPDFLKQAYLKILYKHIDKITPERIHNYMSENVGTRNSFKEFKTELEMHKNLLKERESYLDMLSPELKEKDIHIDKLNDELKERESQLDAFSAELEEKNRRVDKLYKELKEKGPRIEKLYDELKKKDLQIDNLNIELRGYNFRLDKLNTELKERYSQLDALRLELKESDLKLDRLYAKLKEKDSQLNALNVELKGRDSQLDRLLAELKEKDSQLNALNVELKGRDSQLDRLLAELKGRDSQLDRLLAELKGRDPQLDMLLATLRGKDSALDKLSYEVRQKDAQLINLQFMLRDRDIEIAAIRKTRGWRILEQYRKIRDHILLRKNIVESPKDKSFKSPIQKPADKTLSAQIANKIPNLNKATHIAKFLNDTIDNPIQSRVSIIIPTKDAGDEFDYALRRVSQQEGINDIEIIIIDSGSRDNTIAICKRYTQNIFHVYAEEFHHARTRNLGAEKATGDFLVFTVQDAVPVGGNWLYKLIYPIYSGRVSAVSARQIPRADADLFASWAMWVHNLYLGYNHDRVISSAIAKDFDNLDLQGKRAIASLDSVCLAIKKSTFDAYRFNSGYAEDVDLGIRLIKDDNNLLFQSSNAVVHSHNRTAMYFLKRGYVDTVYLWNILKIERKTIPVELVLETLSYLYSVLKICVFELGIECEMKKEPVALVHSFLDNFEKRMTAYDRSWQPMKGDQLLDDFFEKVTPRNKQNMISEILPVFRQNLLSFSDYMKCFATVDEIKEDFLESLYKLFSSGAGYYLGANTRDKIDSLIGGI
jgi:glycosyltransferase involved in cell wall biosynthesis